MKYVFVLKSGTLDFEKVEYTNKEVTERLEWYKDKIGCDWVEVVQLPRFIPNSCLIVDEDGLLKKDPEINYIASLLYDTPVHGNPIAGNAVLCSQKYGINGVDTTDFDADTAALIEQRFEEIKTKMEESEE